MLAERHHERATLPAARDDRLTFMKTVWDSNHLMRSKLLYLKGLISRGWAGWVFGTEFATI